MSGWVNTLPAMPGCGARYLLVVRTASGVVCRVSAQYNEVRDPDAFGRPGRIRSREIVRCIVDGRPVLRPFATLEEALGGPFDVLSHGREEVIRWFLPTPGASPG